MDELAGHRFVLQDRTPFIVPNNPNGVQPTPALPPTPVVPIPGNPAGITPDTQRAAQVVLDTFYARREQIIEKYMPSISRVVADAVLGPGELDKAYTRAKDSQLRLQKLLDKADLPQFKEVDEALKLMRASVRANGGKPETNPEIIKRFQEKLNKIVGHKKEAATDADAYPVPEDGYALDNLDVIEQAVKGDLCQEKFRSQLFELRSCRLKFGEKGRPLIIPEDLPESEKAKLLKDPEATMKKRDAAIDRFPKLKPGNLTLQSVDSILEESFPGAVIIDQVIPAIVDLRKSRDAYFEKQELIAIKRKELGRAWITPGNPRHLPKLKELGDAYQREILEALDIRDKGLRALGLEVEVPAKAKP